MSVNEPVRADGVGAPSANYELATLSTSGVNGTLRQLHTSGIGPVRGDGTVPSDLAEQAEVVWSALSALLAAAEMTVSDVVQVTTYVVHPATASEVEFGAVPGELRDRLTVAMAARDGALAGHKCASVLVPVPALATSSWLLEVAIVAVSQD